MATAGEEKEIECSLSVTPMESMESSSSKKDRYGFSESDLFHKSLQLDDVEKERRAAKERERELKWIVMIKSWYAYNSPRNIFMYRTLKSRLRKGVPDSLRVPVWKYYLNYEEVKRKYGPPPSIEKLAKKLPPIIFEDIDKDIDRTFPTHDQFANGADGQRALKYLLECYAALDMETGYCQGMSFVAAFLLTYMVPEEAYYCFISLMLEHKYKCRKLYQPDMYETQCMLYVFGYLGRVYLGKLWEHLDEQHMDPSMYATEWFMTMFCRGFSFDLVTRVFDLFVNDGIKTLYRVSLALLKSMEGELMKASFEDIMAILRNIPSKCDAEVVMKIAFKIPLRRQVIKRFEDEYVEVHKARLAERAANRERRANSAMSSPAASVKTPVNSPRTKESKAAARADNGATEMGIVEDPAGPKVLFNEELPAGSNKPELPP